MGTKAKNSSHVWLSAIMSGGAKKVTSSTSAATNSSIAKATVAVGSGTGIVASAAADPSSSIKAPLKGCGRLTPPPVPVIAPPVPPVPPVAPVVEEKNEYCQKKLATQSEDNTNISMNSSNTRQQVSYKNQLEYTAKILDEAIVMAITESVPEQACSVISRGMCHLCSADDKVLLPVINCCAQFDVKHSLCYKHLSSLYLVQVEDVVKKKRPLRCAVCSYTCPCGRCKNQKKNEIIAYKKWLTQQDMVNIRTYSDIQQQQDQKIDMVEQSQQQQEEEEQDIEMMEQEEEKDQKEKSNRNRRRSSRSTATGAPAGSKKTSRTHQLSIDTEAVEIEDEYDHEQVEKEEDPLISTTTRRRRDRQSGEQHAAAAESKTSPRTGSTSRRRTPKRASKETDSSNNTSPHENLTDMLESLNKQVAPAVKYLAGDSAPVAEPKAEREEGEEEQKDARGYGKRRRETAPTGFSRRQQRDESSGSSSSKNPSHSRSGTRRSPGRGSVSGSRGSTPVGGASSVADTSSGRSKATTSSGRAAAAAVEAMENKSKKAEKSSGKTSRGSRRHSGSSVASTDKKEEGGGEGGSSRPHRRRSKSGEGLDQDDGESADVQQDEDEEEEEEEEEQQQQEDSSPNKKDHHHHHYHHHHRGKEAEGEEEEEDDDIESELDANLDFCEICQAAGDLVCCDMCPRSYHLDCLQMEENDLPEGDWQCDECKKPSYFIEYANQVQKKKTTLAKCQQIIRCLQSHRFSKPFLLPVEDVPNYELIVKNPMDLTSVYNNLGSGKYLYEGKKFNLLAFAQDVRLIWSNCKAFNEDGSGVVRAANELAQGFEGLYEQVLNSIGFNK